jgi:hypothetical protein
MTANMTANTLARAWLFRAGLTGIKLAWWKRAYIAAVLRLSSSS